MARLSLSFFLSFFLFLSLEAQVASLPHFNLGKEPLWKITFKKSGPYIGVQRGLYTILEIGGEYQYKKIKLVKPPTHAAHMGFNYNFKYNVLGYDAGYWFKTGRLNLTYGGNLVFRTDFTHNRLGFAPVIGFKFMQFHLQTGYTFLTKSPNFTETNTFFVALRFVLINNRDLDIKKRKKK